MTGGATEIDPRAAWVAASQAVTLVMGARPPDRKARRQLGIERAMKVEAWRRKLAVYTAAVSLGVGVEPLIALAGLRRRTLREILHEMETKRDLDCIDGLLELLAREAERQLARAERMGRAA